MKALFVRHCETNYNVEGLCNDDPSVDVHLTEKGKEQARELRDKLEQRTISLIFISDLSRTKETAEIVNECHHAPVKIDARISDRKTGFEGRPVSEFKAAVKDDPLEASFNNGESFQEEKERVYSFLSDLSRLDYELVLVITHFETMQIIAGYYYDLGDQQVLQLSMPHGHVFEVDISDWRGY